MKKWYEGVYRRQLTDMHIPDFDRRFLSQFSAEEYYENLRIAGIESPMIYLQSHTGLCNYPTESAKTHARFKSGENELKRLISLCKDGGMKVVGYYSLIFNNVAADMHPSWEMRDSNGESWRDRGQRYGLCCPNNTEYREFLKTQIDELAREFKNIDGLFYDMPYWEMTCYCDHCRREYKKVYGRDIPTKMDFRDPEWLSFVRARQDFMVEFVRFVREYTARVMPWVTIEFNYAAVVGCDWLGGSTEGINAESEFTGGDLYGDLYSHSFACKYYYGVTKNQPFEYMTCRCDRTLREHTVTKSQSALEREILFTAAHHGASLVIDAIDPIGRLDRRVYERIGAAFSRQIPFEKYMDHGSLYAEVAVYFDSRTMFSASPDTISNKASAINAVKRLVEAHIPVAVVANGALDDLSKYSVVVAPSLSDFENDEPKKLIDYVRRGGTLYLSGGSDSRLIKEFFGARVVGYTYSDAEHKHRVQMGARVYISPTEKGEGRFGEFTAEYPLPLTYYLPLISGAEGEVLATVALPYADPDDNTRFSSIHSCPPWQNTDYPAFVEREYGQGRVIWCAATLENDDREAFRHIFHSIIGDNVNKKYHVVASEAIECVIFESESESLLSFCDLKYDAKKSASAVEVQIRIPTSPKRVINAETGEEIAFKYDACEKNCSFALLVSDFGMVVVS